MHDARITESSTRTRAIWFRPSIRSFAACYVFSELQLCLVLLPLLLQIGHKRDKSCVGPQVRESRITLEHWIARKTIIRRQPQPPDCLRPIVHQRISRADGIRGVWKMPEAFDAFDSHLNHVLRLGILAVAGQEQSLH